MIISKKKLEILLREADQRGFTRGHDSMQRFNEDALLSAYRNGKLQGKIEQYHIGMQDTDRGSIPQNLLDLEARW